MRAMPYSYRDSQEENYLYSGIASNLPPPLRLVTKALQVVPDTPQEQKADAEAWSHSFI